MQFTLRVIRGLNGYTQEEVALYCGVPISTLDELETDSGIMPISLISKLLTLYKVSSSIVYFGTESDCIKRNRS